MDLGVVVFAFLSPMNTISDINAADGWKEGKALGGESVKSYPN